MTTQNWLDIIPAIPLARGVPVIVPGEPGEWGGHGIVQSDGMAHLDSWLISVDPEPISAVYPGNRCRIDLADPQGFAAAMRWLLSEEPFAFARALGWTPDKAETDAYDRRIVQALLSPTDDDRLALAKALAEVTL
mgnify:CR=1 FL=1